MTSKKFPIRPRSHALEDKSENFFKSIVPPEWIVRRLDRDYGRDIQVEITQGNEARGEEFTVQLKASDASTGSGDNERQVFKVTTYNYLKRILPVVMIVKYVDSEHEAYWIWLRDIPEPSLDQETFTIHIPRTNQYSRIDWGKVVSHVDAVTGAKLDAGLALRSIQPK
ncbi:protein of unknown function [Chryseolinea serpens]|uniref:DUF4365 domain-containing protein n=1 Tax=Chryseolinea serpens TaxID=947013 RepID=A0A1M5XQL5_9BACT|nr:DUF4365 domain-containing protein [Chryseolinea serpens]SHI01824.1 protein of unknown function [Chryseolinea serpens]